MFELLLQHTAMPIHFEQENRLGITPLHQIVLYNRIEFIFLILTKYPDTVIVWDNPIGKQTCHGIDDMTGKRCTNIAKEEGYCHEEATHVREMVMLQRKRQQLKEQGKPTRNAQELLELNAEEKITGLRAQQCSNVAQCKIIFCFHWLNTCRITCIKLMILF